MLMWTSRWSLAGPHPIPTLITFYTKLCSFHPNRPSNILLAKKSFGSSTLQNILGCVSIQSNIVIKILLLKNLLSDSFIAKSSTYHSLTEKDIWNHHCELQHCCWSWDLNEISIATVTVLSISLSHRFWQLNTRKYLNANIYSQRNKGNLDFIAFIEL